METPAVFSSWADLLGRYLKTRFPARIFVPCAAFLVIAGLAGGAARDAGSAALAAAMALGLLLQFRLMDDLADRDHDRRAHPARVLPQARSLAPFLGLLAAAFLFNCAAIGAHSGAGPRLGVFLALTTLYACWYGVLRDHVPGPLAGYHIVVAKYPVFVLLASAGEALQSRLLPAMALVYLCFAIFEALHDDELRASPAVATVLAVEAGAFFTVALVMVAELSRNRAALALAQGLLACAALALLVRLIGRRRAGVWPARASYLVFAIGLALSLTYSIGGMR